MRRVVLDYITLQIDYNRRMEQVWADLLPKLETLQTFSGGNGVGGDGDVVGGGGLVVGKYQVISSLVKWMMYTYRIFTTTTSESAAAAVPDE